MGVSSATAGGAVPLPVLGWKEIAALPDWGIAELKVKLDTGAKSSALHVEGLRYVTNHSDGDGREPISDMVDMVETVAFEVPLTRITDGPRVTVTAPVVGYRSVRDTRARPERRPVVRTRLRCGPIDEIIDVTLTNRSGMLFRMILGRRALRTRVVVDPGQVFTTRRRPAEIRGALPR